MLQKSTLHIHIHVCQIERLRVSHVMTWLYYRNIFRTMSPTKLRPKIYIWLINSNQWRPEKLTWNLKITCLKRKIIFQISILGFHLDFQWCNLVIVVNPISMPRTNHKKSKPVASAPKETPCGRCIPGVWGLPWCNICRKTKMSRYTLTLASIDIHIIYMPIYYTSRYI